MIVMYESTAHDDQVLRVPATRCLVQKHTLVAESEEVLKVVLKYEPVAWELGLLLQKEKTEVCSERGELENAVENFVRELSNTSRQLARLRLSQFMPPGSLD
jgi:hypothetical protein